MSDTIHVGDIVLIDSKCKKTDATYTVVNTMEKYLGTIQTVNGISYQCVAIRGFNWHIDDVKKITFKPINLPESQKFEVEELYLGE